MFSPLEFVGLANGVVFNGEQGLGGFFIGDGYFSAKVKYKNHVKYDPSITIQNSNIAITIVANLPKTNLFFTTKSVLTILVFQSRKKIRKSEYVEIIIFQV